eukprot:6279083-Heterocapsa_arctica.AAC.1
MRPRPLPAHLAGPAASAPAPFCDVVRTPDYVALGATGPIRIQYSGPCIVCDQYCWPKWFCKTCKDAFVMVKILCNDANLTFNEDCKDDALIIESMREYKKQ